MGFDWLGYRRLAQRLVADSPDEAALRSAISRVYYAVYHVARQRLAHDRVVVPRGEGDLHERTWSAFRRHYTHPHRGIGVDGDRLRHWRTNADYQPQMSNLGATARVAMELADQVLARLTDLPDSSEDVLIRES